jgi:rare lipoprotein A
MSIRMPRRTLLALALIAPVTAAHPTETPAAAVANGFDTSFSDYHQLPAATDPAPGAVDLTTIEHTQPGADDGGEGRLLGSGMASYYGRQFDGRRTASGETFDMTEMTAAHRTLPFGTKVRVTNADNGRSVVVRINDRGPFSGGRLIDVSRAAAQRLGLIASGHGRVTLKLLD